MSLVYTVTPAALPLDWTRDAHVGEVAGRSWLFPEWYSRFKMSCCILGCDAVHSGRSVSTFQRNLLPIRVDVSAYMQRNFCLRLIYFVDLVGGSAVGWSSALQSGRSQVWFLIKFLRFLICLVFPSAVWSWGRLSFQQKWVPGMSSGRKGSRCLGLTTLLTVCADCLEILGASDS
jgi:hypothetical protein